MAEVKWIKIVTDIFDDEKILLIKSMPDADSILVMWFELLCLAGKKNRDGIVTLTDKIAYTDEMLSNILRRPLSTVRLALQTFEQLEMIEIVNGAICITNWEKHQNLDKMEQIREQTRQRVAKHREKQKALLECNDDCNVTVTLRNDTDKIREDKEKIRIDYKSIIDAYNEICISFPKVTALSDKRKKSIKARLSSYSVEQFKEVFRKAEQSKFLKGDNKRKWKANFDWMINDSNFAKIIDGNYDDSETEDSFDIEEFFNLAVNHSALSRKN